jgi:F0F1-type ATP synthase membrane subunit c/vacuolar-type H+-ATPase subunit K
MAIAWFVAPTVTTPSENLEHILLMAGILAVLSIGHLLAAQILFANRVRAAEKLPSPEQRLAGYRTAIILAFALREAIAVYGLVLSFLSGDVRWCLGFGAVALVSMLMGWPKSTTMERLCSEVPPIG